MTDAYVKAKVKEALEATGGDKRDTQKLLVTWAVRDQQLLLGFSKPHLKGLVTAKIEEVMRKGKKKKGKDSGSFSKKDMAAMIEGHTKGEKRKQSKVPPPKSSVRQATVMQQIAAAFKKK